MQVQRIDYILKNVNLDKNLQSNNTNYSTALIVSIGSIIGTSFLLRRKKNLKSAPVRTFN